MEKQKTTGEGTEEKKPAGGLIARFMKLDVKKKIQYVAILLVILVILTIYFASSKGAPAVSTDESAATPTISVEDDSIEAKLKDTLSKIDGAGEVDVMITYESSAEIVPAISVDTQNSTTTQSDENGNSTTSSENTQSEVVTVNTDDGSTALVLKEKSPEIKGVLVVAQGADNIGVRLNLLKAVQTILNVSPDRVDVYKMNK